MDVSSTGTYTLSAVANGAAAPAVAADSIRLFRAVTNASAITSIADFRTLKPAAKAHNHGIGDLPVADNGASSTTQVVRADDARLSNARTPTAHTHTAYKDVSFFQGGDINAKVGLGHAPIFRASTAIAVRVALDTAPAGDSITVTVVREAGGPGGTVTTIGSVTIAASARVGSATGLSVALAAGDTLRADITVGGGYTAGSAKNLSVAAETSYAA